jgi:hypothetical protein
MNDTSNSLEGLKLISDWAKWLITIETGAIAIIGAVIRPDKGSLSLPTKILATAAIICFLVSIAAAALLLLSLPEIAQNLRPEINIWWTRDSIIGRVFHLNTQDFAVIESFFFGLGVVCLSALIIAVAWSPAVMQNGGTNQSSPPVSIEHKNSNEPVK